MSDATLADFERRGFVLMPLKAGLKEASDVGWNEPDYMIDPCKVFFDYQGERNRLNVAVLTRRSGIFVLDVDTEREGHPADGFASLEALTNEYGPLPDTFTVRTRAGGLHYYFKDVPGLKKDNRGRVGAGIDIQAGRAYVVAPPSWVDADSKGPAGAYTVEKDLEVADAPAWLIALAMREDAQEPREQPQGVPGSGDGFSAAYVARAVAGEVERVLNAPSGTGNDALNTAAFNLGTLVGAGALTMQDAFEELLEAAQNGGRRDYQESTATLHSGLRAGALHPRVASDPHEGVAAVLHGDPTPLISSIPEDRWAGRFLTANDLLNLPAPKPLIEDTLDLNTVAMLAGKWGSYKSFISLDWAWSTACGLPWAGRQSEPLPVLYLAGEGAHGIGLRYRAWTQAKGTAPAPDRFHLAPQTPRLLDKGDVNDLCSHIRRLGIRFVIVDTLSKSIAGADENSAKDMSMAIDALYRIQDATNGGTVLAVHHNGKNGDLRGSSALEGGVDTVYVVEKDGQAVNVKRTKRKDGPLDDLIAMQFQQVDLGKDEAGRPVTSGFLQSHGGETLFEDAASATRLLSHLLSQPDGDPDTKAQIIETTGLSRATFYRALSDLEERGYAQKITTGRTVRYAATHEARVSQSHHRLTTM